MKGVELGMVNREETDVYCEGDNIRFGDECECSGRQGRKESEAEKLRLEPTRDGVK
jgi:hypothetical protein